MIKQLKNKFCDFKEEIKMKYEYGKSLGKKGSMAGSLLNPNFAIAAVIGLVIVLNLVPTVNSNATTAEDNSSGAAATLYGLVSLIFAAVIILGLVGSRR